MSSNPHGYLAALLRLSGDASFADARKKVLENITDKELNDVIKSGLAEHPSRACREHAALLLLDDIAETARMPSNEPAAGIEAPTSQIPQSESRGSTMINQAHSLPPQALLSGISSSSSKRPTEDDRQETTAKRSKTSEQPRAQASSAQIQKSAELALRVSPLLGECILVPRNAEDNSARETNDTISTRKPQFSRTNDFVLWVPGTWGIGDWKELDELPASVLDEMQTAFYKHYQSNPGTKQRYENLVRKPEPWLDPPICIGIRVVARTVQDRKCAHVNGENTREYGIACGRCIRQKRLCATVVRLDAGLKVAIFPLPEEFRVGQAWDEMSFWVCK